MRKSTRNQSKQAFDSKCLKDNLEHEIGEVKITVYKEPSEETKIYLWVRSYGGGLDFIRDIKFQLRYKKWGNFSDKQKALIKDLYQKFGHLKKDPNRRAVSTGRATASCAQIDEYAKTLNAYKKRGKNHVGATDKVDIKSEKSRKAIRKAEKNRDKYYH